MQESMFSEQELSAIVVPITEKKCSTCHKLLPITDFHVYSRGIYNRSARCKSCALLKHKVSKRRELIHLREEKLCPKCGHTFPLNNFYQTEHSGDGLSSWCKGCMKENARKRPQKQENIRRIVLRKYGMTLEMYDELMQKQNGVCASCGEREVHSRRNKIMSLSVDHCHITGKVRGLLCNNCNVALGHLKDDPERIKALLKYLESHNDVEI